MQRTLQQIPTYMLPQICNLRYITGYENMADYKSAITHNTIRKQLREYGSGIGKRVNEKLIVKNGTGN